MNRNESEHGIAGYCARLAARVRGVGVALWCAAALAGFVSAAEPVPSPSWMKLPSIPDAEGFAAAFAGVSDQALLVGGGANITGEKWGETFQKTWYDSVFVLEKPDGVWRLAGTLPRSIGYGVSITTREGIFCIGGSDAKGHFAEVFKMEWRDGKVVTTALPGLPKPCANACGALVGKTIYVAGGIETPTATTALKNFWKLELDARPMEWAELKPWPGPERMLAVAGVQDKSFFLFSGAKLTAGKDGKPVREYLRDAYRYTPGYGWKRIADLPRAAVAAPSPAIAKGNSQLQVASGDDGTKIDFQPVEKHPGFPRDVLAYDVVTDKWSVAGEAPFSRATAPTVMWKGYAVVPNGEARPRVRTPEVWALKQE